MTLEEELQDLELAAQRARTQGFPGLADAFDRVADSVRADIGAGRRLVPAPPQAAIRQPGQRANRATIAA